MIDMQQPHFRSTDATDARLNFKTVGMREEICHSILAETNI